MPHLITLSLPRHRSPVRTSTWPIVKKSIWSSYSFLFRMYVPVNLVNTNTSHLIIIPLPLHPSPDRTWTLSIVWKPLMWHLLHASSARTWTWSVWILSRLIIIFLLIRLQKVREIDQLSEYLSPDHLITSSLCLQDVRELGQSLEYL